MFDAVYHALAAIEKHNVRQEWIATLPPEQQAEIRAADAKKAKEDQDNQRALEIANAGRARNFWGN